MALWVLPILIGPGVTGLAVTGALEAPAVNLRWGATDTQMRSRPVFTRRVMKPESDNLVVRQQERVQCALPVDLRVAPEDAAKVVLSSTAGAGGGLVRAKAVDGSLGGMGIETPVFFPKSCRVSVRVPLVEPGTDPGVEAIAIELAAQVKRVTMLNRTPVYYIGVLFLGKGAEFEFARARLMEFVTRGGMPARRALPGA